MPSIIIHISNDYPDILAPEKTKAVQHLVDGTPEYRHIVYSLNRVNGWSGISSVQFAPDRTAVAYKALPKGFFWDVRLKDVGDYIIQDLIQKDIVPDMVQGHKFTVEGLVAQQVAAYFKKPFSVSIQGDTDTNILAKKPNLRSRYQSISDSASIIFPFAIWPVATFQKAITLDNHKICVIPVVPSIETVSPAPVVKNNKLLTVFHLDSWNRKNIAGVLHAMQILLKDIPDLHLDICGRGSPKTLIIVRELINTLGLDKHVTLLGPAPNGDLPKLFKNYVGFVLPTKRESYGLVFAEALLSGLPILLSKDRGIDGFFETEKIGYACDPFDVNDIAAGMRHILQNEAELKSSIEQLQVSGQMNCIKKQFILEKYRTEIQKLLSA